MGQQLSRVPSGFTPEFYNTDSQDYFLTKFACTGSFIGLLLLLSWCHGQSGFEQRSDPVAIANEERDAAIEERDDAQCAWAEMGTKYEGALETILKLQNEFTKAFKDLPWLNQRNSELAEENAVQHNEIEHLKTIQQKYDELLHQVATYGMAAKPPEFYQRISENTQRDLEVSNNLLRKSWKDVKTLEEKLEAERETANQETGWLRAQLKKNSRSVAYWAKFRMTGRASEIKPAWGVRCACTEPEIAYGLKDQTPRIVELKATVAARDLTITRLRGSHRNVPRIEASKTATEDLISDNIHGSQIAPTALVHACEHEQQCKDLSQKVADDAKAMGQLCKECQDLKDAASNHTTAEAAEIDAKAKLEGELAEKDAVIEELREEKISTGREQATKDKEIGDLREEKRSAAAIATTDISNLNHELSDTRKELGETRAKSAQWEREIGQQKIKINELETAQRGLKNTIEQKDSEINDLEEANQEIATQPTPESSDTLQRLESANTNLAELRRHYAECEGQSKTQAVRINELEAAGRELEATTKLKDDRIASLEEQIREAPTRDFVERQNEAINTKDRDYYVLYHHYQGLVGQQQLAQTKRDEDTQTLNTMRQNDTEQRQELHRLWTENNELRDLHQNDDGRINDLMNQLRQSSNTYTDLQIKYNTQANELDVANQNVTDLRSEIANLQKANASNQQINSPSEDDFEKYRVEGEERARPIWQANADRELSAQVSKLRASENRVFKLENQLQQAKNQATPLREMQLKSREDAVRLREDALKLDTDAMDHDQQASKGDDEIKAMEAKLAAANQEAGNAKLRNRGIQNELNKERKERKDEKERHARELKKEQEDAARRSDILKLRLEKDNPLKGTVSQLQNEVARLKKKAEERESSEKSG